MTSDEIIDELIASLGTAVFTLARADDSGELKYVSGNRGFGHDLRGLKMISKDSGRWCLTVLGRAVRQRVLDDPRYLTAARVKADKAQQEFMASMAKIFDRKFPHFNDAGDIAV